MSFDEIVLSFASLDGFALSSKLASSILSISDSCISSSSSDNVDNKDDSEDNDDGGGVYPVKESIPKEEDDDIN